MTNERCRAFPRAWLRRREPDSTLIADVARASVGSGPLFAMFQVTSALLLLAAASSSFQAGPGLLKALARRSQPDGSNVGILPAALGRTNDRHTPYWSVVVFLGFSVGVVLAARGRDQGRTVDRELKCSPLLGQQC